MINGIHGMFYTSEAEALRAFLRDELRLPCADAGHGWLVFGFAKADMGAHPTDHEGSPPSGTHSVSFTCDDIEATVAELKGRGVELDGEIVDRGYGLCTELTLPGGVKVELVEPRYERPELPKE